jgi:hypothetical protein
VTPLPLQLDHQPHTLALDLEPLAYALSPSSTLRLELIPATNVYGNQRSTGSVELTRAALTLPLGESPVSQPPPSPEPCRPRFRPRSVERREDGRVRLRPRVRCGGEKVHVRVKITDGRHRWSRRSFKVSLLRVRPNARRLVVRFRHDHQRHKARIRIRR